MPVGLSGVLAIKGVTASVLFSAPRAFEKSAAWRLMRADSASVLAFADQKVSAISPTITGDRRKLLAMPLDGDPCDPTANGRFTRRHAPEAEVSSRVAGLRRDVPVGSFQETSAIAHSVFLGSISRPSMPSVSASIECEFSYLGLRCVARGLISRTSASDRWRCRSGEMKSWAGASCCAGQGFGCEIAASNGAFHGGGPPGCGPVSCEKDAGPRRCRDGTMGIDARDVGSMSR